MDLRLVRPSCTPFMHNVLCKTDIFLSCLWVCRFYILYTLYLQFYSAKQNMYGLQRQVWRPLMISIKQREMHAAPYHICCSNTGCLCWLCTGAVKVNKSCVTELSTLTCPMICCIRRDTLFDLLLCFIVV